jgi:hypothetical protein
MLFIVARDHLQLYESLRREFAREHDVQVVLDRRRGERRGRAVRLPGERRRTDRRERSEVEQDLRVLGWALVVPPWRPAEPTDV